MPDYIPYTLGYNPITRIEHYLDAIINERGEYPAPILPVEKYLAKIAGADIEIDPPVTRIEHYLAAICGMSVDIPTPVTRLEMLLYAKAQEASEAPFAPILRIEQYLVDWIAMETGYDVTVVGVSPLLLQYALAGNMHSLTQDGQCEQRNLPAGYTELEYIESDGTQYINTGLGVTENTRAKVTFAFTSSTASTRRVFGKIAGSSSTAINFREYSSFYWFGSNSITAGADTNKHTVDFRTDGKVYKDDVEIGAKGTFGSSSTGTVHLFAELSDGGNINYGSVRIYSYTQYDGDIVVFNAIPAKRNSDNVLGMYDTVSGTFLTNAGTGTFTAGSAVTPSPVTPMDVWCNNGRVVAGNCINSIPDGQGTFVTPSELTTNRIYKAFPTSLVAGRSYTVTVTGASWSIIVQKKKPDGTGGANVSAWVTTNDFVPEAGYIYGIAIRTDGGTADITPADFNGTLTLDTTDGKPWADGTPETLTVSGANLFDKSAVSFYTLLNTSTGEEIPQTEQYSWASDWIPVTPSTAYYFKAGTNWLVRIFEYAADKSYLNLNYTKRNASFTVGASCGYIRFHLGHDAGGEATYNGETMVSIGDTATAYEPYTAQTVNDVPMLLAVGDYKDEAELISGIRTGKVGVYVFDGNTTFNGSTDIGTGGYIRFAVTISNKALGYDVRSNMFETSATTPGANETSAKISGHNTTSNIYFTFPAALLSGELDTGGKRTTAMNAWFASQYNAGHPAIVLYPLITETTETVNPHTITLSVGTNIVSAESEVSGHTLTAEYRASEAVGGRALSILTGNRDDVGNPNARQLTDILTGGER